ncbi:MAG: condensation domain-containing protein, partial [Ruminiclostridium sp.]
MEIVKDLSPQKREELLKKLNENQIKHIKKEAEPDIENRYEIYPLIESQEVYWAGNKGAFSLGDYSSNIYGEIRVMSSNFIITKLVRTRLEKAINKLVTSHDILRTIILPGFRQKILEKAQTYQIDYCDLRARSDAEELINKNKQLMVQRVIKCEEWPLFGICLNRLKKELVIQIKISPLLMDGNGLSIFLSQLFSQLINSKLDIESYDFKYRDYVITRLKLKESLKYKKAKQNKLNRLNSLPGTLVLPLFSPRDRKYNFSIDEYMMLTADEWKGLEQISLRMGVTAPVTLLTLYTDAVTKWSYQTNYFMGLINTYHPPINKSISKIIGNFNTVDLIEVDTLKWRTFHERVKQNQKQLMFICDNAVYSGFEELRELRSRRNFREEIALPLCFNCTTNMKHPDTEDVIFNKKMNKLGFFKKIIPGVSVEEINIYTTQLALVPTLALNEKKQLVCKLSRYKDLFMDQIDYKIFELFRNNLKRLLGDERYWEYSWEQTIGCDPISQKLALNKVNRLIDLKEVFLKYGDREAIYWKDKIITYSSLYKDIGSISSFITANLSQTNFIYIKNTCSWRIISAVLSCIINGKCFKITDNNVDMNKTAILFEEEVYFQIDGVKQLICESEYTVDINQNRLADAKMYYDEGEISFGDFYNQLANMEFSINVNADDKIFLGNDRTDIVWLSVLILAMEKGCRLVLLSEQFGDISSSVNELKKHDIKIWSSGANLLECYGDTEVGCLISKIKIFYFVDTVQAALVSRIIQSGARIFRFWRFDNYVINFDFEIVGVDEQSNPLY